MASSLKQWASDHGTPAAARVVKRIERFANNTTDPDTSLAAQELVKMIKEVVPDGTE